MKRTVIRLVVVQCDYAAEETKDLAQEVQDALYAYDRLGCGDVEIRAAVLEREQIEFPDVPQIEDEEKYDAALKAWRRKAVEETER